jgi:hypothetical protein
MRDSRATVGDGRRELAYTDMGEPDGLSVLFFHGAPSSRLRLAPPMPPSDDRYSY